MSQWILQIMNSFGYFGIALLILAENLFPPIPSEVILTFAGFMTTYTTMHLPGIYSVRYHWKPCRSCHSIQPLAQLLFHRKNGFALFPVKWERHYV